MSLFADRVQETTTTTGTGTVTLGGAVSGYRAFSAAFSSGETVRYAIVLGTEWEVGEGVFTTSGTTLSRVTVFASSNSNALVSFSAGSKAVWCDIPAATLSALGAAASKSVLYRDASANVAGSAVVAIDEAAQEFQIVTAAQSTVGRFTNYAGASVNGANVMFNKARGTLGSPTKALAADQLGGFFARGWHEDGTPGFGPATANAIRFVAEEDFTTAANGSACVIAVSKIGAATAPEVFRVNGHGFITLTCKTASAGSVPMMLLTGAAHTAQTASTELNDVLIDCSATLQFATGAITTERGVLVKARTYAFVGSSTITNAATLAIDRAPQVGTNATITNAYSLWCQAGMARFDGGITFGTLPATAGEIRTNTAGASWRYRDAGNTTNLYAIEAVGDSLYVGTDAAFGANQSVGVNVYGSFDVALGTGATTCLYIYNSNVEAWKPIVGSSVGSSPYSVHGMTVKNMTGSTATLTAAEYMNQIIKITGSGANTIKLPAVTDATAYTKYIWNATSGTLTIQDTNSVGAGTTLLTNTGALFSFSTSDVNKLTASFAVA